MTTSDHDRQQMRVDRDDLEDMSEAAFDDAPVGMALVVLGPDGERTIHLANRALARFLGTTREALADVTCNELTHPDDLAADNAAAARILAGTLDTYRRRKRYRHHDGHYVWADLSARVLRTNGSTVMLSHIIDIQDRIELERALAAYADELEREVTDRTTELARSEAELRAALARSETQREQMEMVLDASRAAIGEWDVLEGTLHLSDSWYRLLGYEPAEFDLEAAPWQDYVHPDDWIEVQRMAEQSRTTDEPFLELTFRVRHKDGSWRWNRHRGVVTEWTDDARPARILGIDLDVTEQRTLEQQLVHSVKMQSLGAFAGGIAHDFNNVLAIIQGHTEALDRTARDLPLSPQQVERIEAIRRSVHRATTLVRNLMLINRPASSGRNLVDVADLLRRSNATLPYLLGEDIRLEITVPPMALPVAIDEGRLEAALLNLAANARDAMPRGGTLRIELETIDGDPPMASLRVTDTGIGMDRTTLDSIFEPFFTTKTPGVGMGLGLATTYATIAEAHGTISAESQPGIGTTISILLPLVVNAQPSPSSGRTDVPAPGSRVAVLIVEDEAELLELTSDVLRDHGLRVHAALDAAEALDVLERYDDIELVITDAVMPGMSGPELASIVRRRWPSIKILFMSGYAVAHPMNDAFGDDQLLTKPVESGRLIRAVTRALQGD